MAGGEEKEYIAEWPPPPPAVAPSHSPAPAEGGEREASCKRLKLSTEEEALITRREKTEKESVIATSGRKVASSPFFSFFLHGEPGDEARREANGALSHLIRSSPSITADILLARWWKDKTKKDEIFLLDVGGAASSNPNTRLFHISRLNAAKEFLRGRINYLTSLDSGSESSSYDIHFSIATCYHRLGPELQCVQPALHHMQRALEAARKGGGGETREARWLLELLERQRTVEERKERGTELMKNWPLEKLVLPAFSKVERRDYSSLSSTEFYQEYALTRTPVIITGIVDKMTSKPWTLDYIREVCL